MIDNKKYLKDVTSMYSTAQRVKKYVMAELDKIDEKYRKVIAEEKKKLNEQLEVLNSQIKFYADIVGAGEKSEEAPKEEVEEQIQDTIFPENNEPEEENVEDREIDIDTDMPGEWVKVPEPVEKKQETKDLDAEEDEEWEQKIQSGEITEVKPEFEKKEVPVLESDESGWGEFPADWQ